MIVVDAHQDIAYNVLTYNRDYIHSARQTQRREQGTDTRDQAGRATLGLPDALLGRVALVCATLFVAPEASKMGPWDTLTYRDAREAYTQALRQMDYYQRLADETARVRLVRTQADLDAVLATWAEGTAFEDHVQGLITLMEGADPILEPKQFEEWYARGVRAVGLAWTGTRYSGGTRMPGPLTDLGRDLLDVLADFNVALDLSHSSEDAFYEALDRYTGDVVIASHSNPRKFCNTDRHLSDDMIRRLAERDGVMGVVMYNGFLTNGYKAGDPRPPLSIILDVVDYVCQVTGSAAHVGLGSDFDGGFGVDSIPEGLETVGDLWNLGPALRARGFSEGDVAAVLGGNMLRKLRQALPAG
jgi:membrane dipeptidase